MADLFECGERAEVVLKNAKGLLQFRLNFFNQKLIKEKDDFLIVRLSGGSESYFLADGALISVAAAEETCKNLGVRDIRELIERMTAPNQNLKVQGRKKNEDEIIFVADGGFLEKFFSGKMLVCNFKKFTNLPFEKASKTIPVRKVKLLASSRTRKRFSKN